MINKAIEKLTNEMMALNDSFSQAIEEHLTGICTNIQIAEKILQPGKTLKGACEAIRTKAKERQSGGVGVVSDSEAYSIAEEYFGINDITSKQSAINVLDLL